jgi:hypothetical protein
MGHLAMAEPLRRPLNLRGLDLHEIDGTEYDWRGADARDICLRGSTLRFSTLAGARLERANLVKADLSHADLSYTQLAAADLRDARLCRTKLVGANLAGANLDGADLSWADLSRTHLEGSARDGALFVGAPIATLLAAGVSPSSLLDERAAALRCQVPPLHFAVTVTPRRAPLRISRKEAVLITSALGHTLCWWEDVTTQAVFAVLYPRECWRYWMPRCKSRLILEWACAHRSELEMRCTLAHLGRVPLTRVLAGVRDEDLPAGVASNAQRVCTRAAERVAAQWDQRFPETPWPPWPGIEPIRWRVELATEGRLMHHCVGRWAAWCLAGERFMYHVGEPAPAGSTVAVSREGVIIEHRAAWNQLPSADDTAEVRSWLAHSAKARARTRNGGRADQPPNA